MIDTQKFAKIIESVRKVLNDSYLLSYTNGTHVLFFLPNKHDEIKEILSKSANSFEGCCYYFTNFSVALWQDVDDAIGFQGEIICCLEFFEDKITREFHWRKKQAIQKGKKMQIPIRIECPHCHWGHSFSSSYINQGHLKGICHHCGETFFFKVTVTGFSVETNKELPDGVPCTTLSEAKDEIQEA